MTGSATINTKKLTSRTVRVFRKELLRTNLSCVMKIEMFLDVNVITFDSDRKIPVN